MFCTISTWEPRVSAKQMASTPRSPVRSTPSPRTRPEARKALCTRWPAASMPRWRTAEALRAVRPRGGRPIAMPTTPGPGDTAVGHQSVELRVDRGPRQPVRLGQVVVGRVGDVQLRGRLRQVLREGGGIGAAFSTFWSKVMTVRRLYAAACSRRARRRPRSAPSESPAAGPGRPQPTHHCGGRRPGRLRHRLLRSRGCGPCQPGRAARHGAAGQPEPRHRDEEHGDRASAEGARGPGPGARPCLQVQVGVPGQHEPRAADPAQQPAHPRPAAGLPARRLHPRPEHPRRGQLFHPVPADRAPRTCRPCTPPSRTRRPHRQPPQPLRRQGPAPSHATAAAPHPAAWDATAKPASPRTPTVRHPQGAACWSSRPAHGGRCPC